jgi:hypothetical protein
VRLCRETLEFLRQHEFVGADDVESGAHRVGGVRAAAAAARDRGRGRVTRTDQHPRGGARPAPSSVFRLRVSSTSSTTPTATRSSVTMGLGKSLQAIAVLEEPRGATRPTSCH